MANLLQKASIVLTPTAYDNGKVLCAKPSEAPYGDFDFSRNSAATRVNAQGLVENVQILSSNLVQNGDFSEEGAEEVSNGSFSQEGSELVTNGDFSSDSDWVKGVGITISGGKANFINSTGDLRQDPVVENGKYYKVTYTISDYVSGSVRFEIPSNIGSGIVRSANGTYTEILLSTGTAIQFDARTSFTGSIDNVSVKEVGQDWTLGGEVTIGDNLAHFESNTNTYSYIRQDISSLTSKTYKIQLEVKNYVSGAIQVAFSGASPITQNLNVSTDGVYTAYLTPNANGDDFEVSREFNGGNFNFDITNISVKEVGQNWSINNVGAATTNITLGALNIITAGDFTNAEQSGFLTSGNNYSLTYTIISNSVVGVLQATLGTAAVSVTVPSTVGTHTVDFTAAGSSAFAFKRGGGALNVSITNISVIEITDDTNLPRINYEGFSYQDALGSELITNGDFATDSDWNKQSGWIITNGYAESTALGTRSIFQNTGAIVIGKTYQVTYTILETNGSIFRINFGGVNGIGRYTVGTYTENIVATSTSGAIYLDALNVMIGKIDNVSVKEYLGQEVVPDSGCGSWLFEPQSTNLIEYSNDYADAYWIKATSGSGIAPVVTSNYAISPDGTQNADRIQFDATTSGSNSDRSRIRTTLTLSDVTDYTFSFYAKSTDGTDQKIGVLFDNSQIGTFTITDEWQRFEVTQQQFGTSSICGLDLRGGVASTSDILVYGIQIEQQSYSTSYIPTDGSTVTRNQDVCTNGGSLASINSTEGTLYFEGSALANDGTTRIISLSDGTTANRVNLFFDTSNTLRAFITGVPSIATAAVITDNNKVALKFKSGDISVWLNGTEVATSTSTISLSGLSNLSFNQVGSSPFLLIPV